MAITAVAMLLVSRQAHAFYAKTTITASADLDNTIALHSSLSTCDNCTRWITLPFTFRYYGVAYTQILVSTDGWIAFGDPGGNRTNNVKFEWNGSAGTTVPMIAPFWDDLDPARNAGEIRYGQVGTHFTVGWWVAHHSAAATTKVWFQIKLFQNNTFEMHYLLTSFGDASYNNGRSATVGYQAGDGLVVATNLFHNQGSLTNGLAWRFTPYVKPMYIAASDMFGALRGGVWYRVPTNCMYAETSIQTGGAWVVVTVPNPVPYGCDANFTMWATPELGSSDIGKEKVFGQLRDNGQYNAYNVQTYVDRGLTPAPSLTQTPSTGGTLKWWDSDTTYFFPLLVVPGLDPLNEDMPDDVLAMLGDMARAVHADGWELVIGKPGNGNRWLSDLRGDVSAWIDLARARSPERKVSAIGISMGGQLLRDYTYQKGSAANTKLAAVYYIDSPLTGANMGAPAQGIQTLVGCYQQNEPNYNTLFSTPSSQLIYARATTCHCKTSKDALNSTCEFGSTEHDNYYNSVGWYSSGTYAKYAFSFGDGVGSVTYRPGGGLYQFSHSSGWCPGFSSGSWPGSRRDCAPGSEYLIPGMVDTSEASGWTSAFGINICDSGSVGLNYNPSFITLDSALGFYVPGWWWAIDNACNYRDTSLPNWTDAKATTNNAWSAPSSYFTGRIANTYNGDHHYLPEDLGKQLRTLLNANAFK